MNTKQLRQKILDLAIRGKLVPQDPSDEPASVLLERVRAEKERLIKEGKIKRDKKDSVIIGGTDKPRYGKLPQRWEISILENICEITSSKRIFKDEYVSFGIPFYRTKEIVELDRGEIITTELFISKERYDEIKSEFGTPKEDDILLSAVGTIGISWVVDDRIFYFKDGNLLWLKNIIVDAKYLKAALDWLFTKININNGSAYSALTIEKLKKFSLPIPPLSEQRRIVSAIESAFVVINELERSKTDLQSAVAAAKQKTLFLAIRGKLVKQDPNDEPASVLLERIQAEREKLINEGKIKRSKGDSAVIRSCDNPYYKNLPESWEVVSLSQITNPLILNDGDWILSENMVKNGDIKLVQLGSVGFMEYIDKGFKYLTSEMFSELNCTTIYPNYLLINRLLGDRLNLCILPNISGTLITTVDTCWIAPNENYNLKFLMYNIASEPFQESIFINSAGSTRKRISKGNLIQIPFSFPPLAEQNRIVAAIEAAFKQLDRIVESLN